jgi:hypothetical protein
MLKQIKSTPTNNKINSIPNKSNIILLNNSNKNQYNNQNQHNNNYPKNYQYLNSKIKIPNYNI